MAESVITVTETDRWDDGQRVHLVGTGVAAAGDYTTGGVTFVIPGVQLIDLRPGFVPLPGITQPPIVMRIVGISGYSYEYNPVTKKLVIRSAGATVPSGTIVSTMTVQGGAAGAGAVGITVDANAFALTKAAATNRTSTVPVVSVFTGTAGTTGAGELPGATPLPAGVLADIMSVYAIFKKNL